MRTKGTVYIGHLPYGFVEEGIKKFFEQYGTVTNVKVARSKKVNFNYFLTYKISSINKKTARSKGYGFVEFEYHSVAEIAAKAMQGYIMQGKQIVCEALNKKGPSPFDAKNG